MPTAAIDTALTASIEAFRLLEHPYYRAWQDGELRIRDLKGYAEQYRHFESCLPGVLATGASKVGDEESRRLIQANLDDELASPRPHLELFDGFGAAVGAVADAEPSNATRELVDLYRDAAGAGPVPLLAVIAAYETQAADIAATKAASLSYHYGLGGADTEFWTIHAAVEGRHAAWTSEALAILDAEQDEVAEWSARSARAWWRFLDEQDSLRAA